jgi:hypothetical protein
MPAAAVPADGVFGSAAGMSKVRSYFLFAEPPPARPGTDGKPA